MHARYIQLSVQIAVNVATLTTKFMVEIVVILYRYDSNVNKTNSDFHIYLSITTFQLMSIIQSSSGKCYSASNCDI